MSAWRPTIVTNGKPHYVAIADAIADGVRSGVLSAGERLPPQRKLAEHLGIDFTTVSRGYAEAQARGLIDSHVGRGTFVLGAEANIKSPDKARETQEDLAMNMPPEPNDPALIASMRNGLDYVSANLIPLLRYQATLGADKDKQAASTWLALRGLNPKADCIAVTPGAHPTMTAILSMIARPGDTVLSERVTYPGIRSIAARFGIRLKGLDIDAEGILPDALENAIKQDRPKALYLNPTLQNPTTLTMSSKRRLAVAQVLRKFGLPLIEDDAYGFIPAKAPTPIAAMVPELTWHIGGLAKCIGAGLRLAYTVTPSPRDTYALAESLRAIVGMPSPVSMALATRWIEDGTADRIRCFIRSESAERQKMASKFLEGFEYVSAENAFNIWLPLPDGAARAEIIARMAGRHIGIIPSDAFTVTGPPDEYVRVCLGGSIQRENLRAGLQFLSHALSQNTPRG